MKCDNLRNNKNCISRQILSAYATFILLHITIFFRKCGDFIGELHGESFDMVHEDLIYLMAADIHHMENVISVAQIYS